MNSAIHGIELPPASVPSYVWWIIAGVVVLFLAAGIYQSRHQYPLASAIRRINKLPNDVKFSAELSNILRSIEKSHLPSFGPLKKLLAETDKARFGPSECSRDKFQQLKTAAIQLLQEPKQ